MHFAPNEVRHKPWGGSKCKPQPNKEINKNLSKEKW